MKTLKAVSNLGCTLVKPELAEVALANPTMQAVRMSRTEEAAAESKSNATLCNNCCKALQKLLVCARCTTTTSVPRTKVHANTNMTE